MPDQNSNYKTKMRMYPVLYRSTAAILQIIKQPSFTLNMLAALLPIYKLQSTPLTNPLLHITTDSIFLQSFKLTE